MNINSRQESLSKVKTWFIYVKSAFTLFYISVAYCIVGITEEHFRIVKGNAWCDLGFYQRAIKNYEKALKAEDIGSVRAAIGWCYAQLGMDELCLDYYRSAYQRDKSTQIAIGLAYAEHHVGNIDESRQMLINITETMSPDNKKYATDIEHLRKMVDLNA